MDGDKRTIVCSIQRNLVNIEIMFELVKVHKFIDWGD